MRKSLFIVVLAVSASVGCSSNRDGQGKSGSSAQLRGDPSRFELAKDPPFTAETRYAAGQFAESQGHLDRAIEQYREALKINPKQESSMYRLGVLYAQTKQYQDAIDVWKQYVEVTGGTAISYSNLGYCFELAGKLPEAELAYRYGVKLEPNSRFCRINYGRMLARVGRELEAIQQFSAVLKPSDVHYNLGAVYEQLGRIEQARSEYHKALEADPDNNEAQARLSMIE